MAKLLGTLWNEISRPCAPRFSFFPFSFRITKKSKTFEKLVIPTLISRCFPLDVSFTRNLLAHKTHKLKNCTPPSIEEFPNDFFNQRQRQHGAVIVNFAAAFYMFWAIAIVCDDYFVPCLEIICDKMGLQSDVAGATFMALGSSAPELFASVIGELFNVERQGLWWARVCFHGLQTQLVMPIDLDMITILNIKGSFSISSKDINDKRVQ